MGDDRAAARPGAAATDDRARAVHPGAPPLPGASAPLEPGGLRDSGVLTVAVEGRSFVISPEQAVWLPTGLRHRVGSLLGAEFRSLWIADESGRGLPVSPTVFGVTPLLKALIVEAAAIEGEEDRVGYAGRVTALILDRLRRAQPLPGALP